jgi:ferredoxin
VAAIAITDVVPRLDPGACVHCGACLSACPTGVFGEGGRPERLLATSVEAGGLLPLALACPLHPEPGRTPAPDVVAVVVHGRCLAGVGLEDLVELAAGGERRVWLDDRPCETCPIGSAREVFASAAAQASVLLRLAGRSPSIALMSTKEAGQDADEVEVLVLDGMRPEVSRRRFFAEIGKAARERWSPPVEAPPMFRRVGEVPSRLPTGAPARRRRLLERMSGWEPPATSAEPVPASDLPFAAVLVDPEACSGCGLCARFCPTGALRFEVEADQDGRTRFLLGERSSLCIDCGICVLACPEDAVSFGDRIRPASLWDPLWGLAASGVLVPCGSCGLPTAAGGRFGDPPRCHSCRLGAGVVDSQHDEAGLMSDLLGRLDDDRGRPEAPPVA